MHSGSDEILKNVFSRRAVLCVVLTAPPDMKCQAVQGKL